MLKKNGQQWFKKCYNDPKWYTRDYDWKTGIMKETKKKEKNKKYYHNNKEKLQKINQDQYRGLSEGEKIIKKKEQRKYGFPNVPEKGKQKLKKYTKEYNKNQYQNISEKDKQKKKECMKENGKNYRKNMPEEDKWRTKGYVKEYMNTNKNKYQNMSEEDK